ncbi:MAG: hypothetical protein V1750_10650 [Acidobacteriota bacterium]
MRAEMGMVMASRRNTGFRRKGRWCGALVALAALLVSNAASTFSCRIGGALGQSEVVNLPVPDVRWARTGFCAAACVKMWRLFCLLPDDKTQEVINAYMGGGQNGQVAPDAIPMGVNALTCTKDAYWDANAVYYLTDSLAKQIASIDSRTPLIALINDGLHAVIVTGGEYHRDLDKYYWDTVTYNDPAVGPRLATAAEWVAPSMALFVPPGSNTLQQVISTGATAGWREYAQNTSAVEITEMCKSCIKYRDN